jgi:hypothetical protein
LVTCALFCRSPKGPFPGRLVFDLGFDILMPMVVTALHCRLAHRRTYERFATSIQYCPLTNPQCSVLRLSSRKKSLRSRFCSNSQHHLQHYAHHATHFTMGKKTSKGEYNDFLDGEKLRDNGQVRTSLLGALSTAREKRQRQEGARGSQDAATDAFSLSATCR